MKNIYELLKIPEKSSMIEIKKKMNDLLSDSDYLDKWPLVYMEYRKLEKEGKENYDKNLDMVKIKKMNNLAESIRYSEPSYYGENEIVDVKPIDSLFKQRNEKQEEKRIEALKQVREQKLKEAKKRKKYKAVRNTIIAGLIVAMGVGAAFEVKKAIENRIGMDSDTCIVYEATDGIGYKKMEKVLKMKDIVLVDETPVKNRQWDMVYEGDVFVARTTKEIALELQNDGKAKIISVNEAIEIIEKSGKNLYGQLKKAKDDEAIIVFTDPNVLVQGKARI